MKGFRKIVINGETWWWKAGRMNVEARSDRTGEKKVIDLSHLTGMKLPDIEHDQHKRNFSITPADIAKWLKMLKLSPKLKQQTK